MSATISKVQQSSKRRDRFREYMRRFNPTAPAQTTIELALVLKDLHGSLFHTLAVRADLEPGSQQLLVGGIGSGKTTELLMAHRWLKDQGHTLPVYIDISAETDLSSLHSGALLASFGLHLTRASAGKSVTNSVSDNEKKLLEAARVKIKEFAFGKTELIWEPEYSLDQDDDTEEEYGRGDSEPGRIVTRTFPGKLKPPFPALQRDIEAIRGPLEAFIGSVQKQSLDVVVIFDGLDRLSSPETFWDVVHQDFRALRRMKVAVLTAAPLSMLYGKGRPISEHFDRIHHLHALSPEPERNSLLRSVLDHRGATGLLGIDEAELICVCSGGVLRDLITLARDAGEAAYIEGSEQISLKHVHSATRQLGQSYRRGLGPEQLKLLRRLDKDSAFDVTSSSCIELLVTGRVLEYSGNGFRIHPALRPLVLLHDGHG